GSLVPEAANSTNSPLFVLYKPESDWQSGRCTDDIVEIESDVDRIHIECAGTVEAEPLIDPESVTRRTERAPLRNERWTPAVHEAAIQFVSEGVCPCEGGNT